MDYIDLHDCLCKSSDPPCDCMSGSPPYHCTNEKCYWYHGGLRQYWAVSIDYDEFHPETYRALELWVSLNQPLCRLASGDVISDYNAALILAKSHDVELGWTSSMERFLDDTVYFQPTRSGGVVIDVHTDFMRPARPDEYYDLDEDCAAVKD